MKLVISHNVLSILLKWLETVGRHNIQTTAVDVQYSYIQISKHHPSVKSPKNCNHTYIPVELRTFPSPLQHVWAADCSSRSMGWYGYAKGGLCRHCHRNSLGCCSTYMHLVSLPSVWAPKPNAHYEMHSSIPFTNRVHNIIPVHIMINKYLLG